MKVIVVTGFGLGWDNVVGVYSTLEAAAKDLEFDSVEALKEDEQYYLDEHYVDNNYG